MHNLYAKVTRRDERGFTLIELLVVIAIIAVLAALVLAALSSAQKGSRDSKRKSDLSQYKTSLAQYQSDNNGAYPGSVATAAAITAGGEPYTSLTPNYMSAFLQDPKSGSSYYYVHPSGATNFGMCADLERKSGTRFEVGVTISQEATGAASACTVVN